MKEKTSKLLLSTFIIAIMVLSVLGYSLLSPEDNTSTRIKYNNYVFLKSNEKWVTYIGKATIYLSFSPKDIENITVPDLTLNDLNSAEKIYLTTSSSENTEELQREFLGNLLPFLTTVLQPSCIEDSKECTNLPIKTCNDATKERKVIYFKESEGQNITYTNNCLVIEGNDIGAIQKIDKLILNLIIK